MVEAVRGTVCVWVCVPVAMVQGFVTGAEWPGFGPYVTRWSVQTTCTLQDIRLDGTSDDYP